MARDLADVLHYFIPEPQGQFENPHSEEPSRTPASRTATPSVPDVSTGPTRRPRNAGALSIVALPMEPDDAVRAALAWNLVVEIARHGGAAVLLRTGDGASSEWPPSGRQPLGAKVSVCPARNLAELYRSAVDAALLQADAAPAGLVLVQVPPTWLDAPGEGAALLKWSLLLCRSEPDELNRAFAQARSIVAARPDARLGVTLHGATSRAGAEAGLGSLARVFRSRLDRDLTSYGLLVDDLQVFRAVESRRPIGLSHPQSLAARALHDVAGLLLEDARDLIPA